MPLACQAFRDYRLGAVTLSAQMLAVVRRMLAGEAVTQADSGLNRREWAELMASLGRDCRRIRAGRDDDRLYARRLTALRLTAPAPDRTGA